jgi:hypothetical protein
MDKIEKIRDYCNNQLEEIDSLKIFLVSGYMTELASVSFAKEEVFKKIMAIIDEEEGEK